jgi:hypothetical protein
VSYAEALFIPLSYQENLFQLNDVSKAFTG